MKITQLLSLAALIGLAGCGGGTVRPPPTNVRFFDAAANFDAVTFLREEHAEASLQYGGGGSVSFDSGQYDFNLDTSRPGAQAPVREQTLSATLSPSRDYTFVAVSTGGQAQMLLASNDRYPAGATEARLTVVDAHPSLGDVDFYVVTPGALPSDSAPRGSLSYGSDALSVDVSPATYHIILTPAGDPNTVLYESVDYETTAGSDSVIVIADPGGRLLSDVNVFELTNNALVIQQLDLEAEARVIQGIDDRMDRDILLDDDTTPLFPAQAFGELSAYTPVTPTLHTFKVTPVATPGTQEAAVSVVPVPGRSYTAVFAGDSTNGIFGYAFGEDMRRLVGTAILRIVNAAGLFDSIDVYILPPGTDITTVFPSLGLGAPSTSDRLKLVPGDYELTFVDPATSAIVGGPVTLTLDAEGIYGALLLNSASGNTIDIDYFYDLAP